MSLFDIIALLLTLAAAFSYLNYRYLRLPSTIGLMLIALATSLLLLGLAKLGLATGIEDHARALLHRVDFSETLLHGMLSFLLFAGALFVNLGDLWQEKWAVTLLATVGVLLSTLVVGFLSAALFGWLGMEVPLVSCLLFGALISPTDPIAVLGILRRAGVAKALETKITGESLFNDGIGVVVFIALLDLAKSSDGYALWQPLLLFVQEAVGGALFGAGAGYLAYRLLKQVDRYQVEVLITLALVTGGYALADALHLSGPIAMVVAGLLIGNHGRALAMSQETREHLDTFWELVDEILNAILFVLMGLEVLLVSFTSVYLVAGLLSIPLVLGARFLSVGLPVGLLRLRRDFSPDAVKVMTWGGMRGGISLAMALSLPPSDERELLLTVTYAVVAFSILVQGLTVGRLFGPVRAS
jgi:CPA1 family monovalent cation:H+ antiporter